MKNKNEAILSEIEGKLKDAKCLIFADYTGLKANEINSLRREMKHNAIEFKIIKNTLSSLLFKKVGIEGVDTYLTGPTAIAFCLRDPVVSSKVLTNFAKEHGGLRIKAGLLDNKIIDASMVESIAKLPSRETLLVKLLSVMHLPLLKLVCLLSEPVRRLLSVITAKIHTTDKKEGESS